MEWNSTKLSVLQRCELKQSASKQWLYFLLCVLLRISSIVCVQEIKIVPGSDVTQCGMKCSKASQLLLCRKCEDKEEEMLMLDCLTKHTKPLNTRCILDTDSGCWTLPQAGRGDSCVYEVRDRGAGDKVLTSTSIRVLDMTYVQTGSDFTQCGMKCPKLLSKLLLSRRCGGKEEELLLLDCLTQLTKPLEPRLHLDTSSGCWTLPQAGRGDSCVYEVRDRGAGDKVLTSTSIRVLDPVLIYNISSTSSRLGEDIAVTVQFSGEESHVTWELDGGRLPERYRLIDDNRTLIIPSVQRNNAERTFWVRVTNPVSEEFRDHQLDIREPDEPVPSMLRYHISIVTAVVVVTLLVGVIYIIHQKCHQKSANENVKVHERVKILI